VYAALALEHFARSPSDPDKASNVNIFIPPWSVNEKDSPFPLTDKEDRMRYVILEELVRRRVRRRVLVARGGPRTAGARITRAAASKQVEASSRQAIGAGRQAA